MGNYRLTMDKIKLLDRLKILIDEAQKEWEEKGGYDLFTKMIVYQQIMFETLEGDFDNEIK